MMCPPKETHHKCISDDASNNTHNVCFIMQREREIHIVIYWIWYENRLLNKSKWREKKPQKLFHQRNKTNDEWIDIRKTNKQNIHLIYHFKCAWTYSILSASPWLKLCTIKLISSSNQLCVCLLNATYNTSAVYKVHFAFFNNLVIKLIY